jgi:outer membrane murein-binding lipoprotein Lpp
MKNPILITGIMLVLVAVSMATVFNAAYTSNGITFYSPSTNGQVYHYGQTLYLNASAGSQYANQPVTITITTPSGVNVDLPPTQTNAQGFVIETLGTFGQGQLSTPGTYTIAVSVEAPSPLGTKTGVIQVVYVPAQATVTIEVLNGETGVPLSGAMVYLYNTTNGVHKLITEGTTGAAGTVTFSVISFNFTQTFQAVAVYSGFVNNSVTFSIVGNQSVTEVIKLYPAVLSIIPFMVMQNGTVVDASNINVPLTSVVVTQGIPASIIAKVEFAGMPISNATVQASSAYPSLVKVLSVSPITSGPYAGDYNITIEAMVVNTTSVPYEVVLSINASYMSLTQSVSVSVQAYYNSLAYLQHYIELIQTEINLLNTEIKTLNTSINSLTTSLSSLNQSITTVTKEVNTLNQELTTVNQTASGLSGTVNSLKTSLNTLSTDLSSLNTTVNQLKSQVNGILPLVYGGIIAGILGLIVAIIAIVLVYRKIS